MLQANTNLGYRDVQEILAYSARTPASVTSTAVSFSTDWNGGAHGYSPDAGFGNVDALAAVRLAETWDKRSTELCPNLGDDGLRGAAYRGGWKPA